MKVRTKKRVISLLLAVVMLFAMAVPALAAGGSGNGGASITINAVTGFDITQSTFKAYKIFNLVSSDNGSGGYNYAYTLNTAAGSDFSGFTNYPSSGGTVSLYDYLTGLAQDPTNNNSAAMNTLAANLWAYIVANNIQPAGTAPAAAAGATSVTISPLDYGYYLVYSTNTHINADGTPDTPAVVAACTLTTTMPDPVITPKVDAPTIDKQVVDSTGNPSNYTSASIGDTVNYQLTSAVPDMTGYSSYVYTVHDVMSPGLTFNPASVQVYVGSATSTPPATIPAPAANYTVVTTGLSDGCTFEIVFNNFYANYNNQVGAPILIKYTATINENAAMAPDANTNEANLEYSNNPYDSNSHGTTPPSEADVYTSEFDIFKYDGSTVATNGTPLDTGVTALAGAVFELRTTSGNQASAIKFVDLGGGSYRVAKADDTTITTTLTTPASGLLNLQGVGAGTYYLTEITPPAGFNALPGPVTLTVALGQPVTGSNQLPCHVTTTTNGAEVLVATNGNDTVCVANSAGSQFPITGGTGTALFLIGGLLLMVLAAAALIARRKMHRDHPEQMNLI
ncbi:MAG: SpaH/EbpB family LPXTG-anchored major pilin [Firmicutes bacterium]|nr:SpaH/EbpB family LPXTG-anchored major pilin [Bacillota bacterium]